MNSYQQLQENLRELKLTQMSLQIDDYINKINDHKISIVDALCELTSKEVEAYGCDRRCRRHPKIFRWKVWHMVQKRRKNATGRRYVFPAL